ncbi:hypothetical protein QCA50_004615 [Cerrena zonata]|uniref:BAG domain-containing protein n=1 Tax=Cerrena zonata TaxID=2478898 RepID=A0AAW0GPK3_9APHY
MTYVVKWGRERLYFPLPAPDTKLAVVRKQISDYTQLSPDSFKLVHAGAVMKDDNAPISAYGIKENSNLAVIGGGEGHLAEPKKSKKASPQQPRTQESTISQIRSEVDKVRQNLKPDVESFLSTLQPSAEPANPNVDSAKEHIRLGELLLQSLLRLDAINAEGEWEEARKERKGAVKEVQGLLDTLDGGWKNRVQG